MFVSGCRRNLGAPVLRMLLCATSGQLGLLPAGHHSARRAVVHSHGPYVRAVPGSSEVSSQGHRVDAYAGKTPHLGGTVRFSFPCHSTCRSERPQECHCLSQVPAQPCRSQMPHAAAANYISQGLVGRRHSWGF